MTDQSNPEHLGKVVNAKPTSLAEDSSYEPADTDTHNTSGVGPRANRSTKAAKSKREIMEDLSRERFPWEE